MTNTRSFGCCLVVRLQLGDRLEPERRLAAPLLAEDQGRRGVGRAAEELVPGRVVDRHEAAPLEDRVGLGVFLAERVAGDPVVLEKLFGLHPRSMPFPSAILSATSWRRQLLQFPYPRLTRSDPLPAIASG